MKPNALFVNLPSIPYDSLLRSFNGKNEMPQTDAMPMGIMYLSSYLKKYGDPGKIGTLDYAKHICEAIKYKNLEDFIGRIAQDTVDFTPDIVAVSIIFSTAHRLLMEMVDYLKMIWPNAVFVIGGTHATNCVKGVLENKNIDYVVRGEGEKSFCEFVGQFGKNQKIEIKGIYSSKDIEEEKGLELSEFIEDLNIIPFPDWEIIDMEFYTSARGRRRDIGTSDEKKVATMMTTRGCVFECTFCASHTVHGRKMRYRSEDNVIEELMILNKRYGINSIIPEDDLFTVKHDRIMSLLKKIKQLDIEGMEMQFPNALSINTLSEELLDALVDSGMSLAVLAIESGSDYVQKNIIRKRCNLDKAKRLVKYLKGKDIVTRCFFIFGFPGETREMMQETIDYAIELGADWNAFQIAAPLVGSEMYCQFVERGDISNDVNRWCNTFYSKRDFDTPEIGAEELIDFTYRANLEVNFLNNPNLINGKYEKAAAIYKDILRYYPFHIIARYCLIKCYGALGMQDKVQDEKNKIISLINEDDNAKEIFDKYSDMMPDIIEEIKVVLRKEKMDGKAVF